MRAKGAPPDGEIRPENNQAAPTVRRTSLSGRTFVPEKTEAAAAAPRSVVARQISTPEKQPERRTRSRDGVSQCSSTDKIKAGVDAKLPENEAFDLFILCEFFNCLESSIRLLRLKGSMATFPNVCTSIQHLSGRRFTYSNLAKLKHLLPEAIVIKRIVLRDEVTCCMRPDLQVSLIVDAVESNPSNKGETGYSVLRGIFWQRLLVYFQEHPEGDDILEHELPHPFNQTKSTNSLTKPGVVVKPTVVMPTSVPFEHKPAVLSHMSATFKRRFSQKSPAGASLMKSSSSLVKEGAAIPSLANRSSLFNSPNFDSSFLNSGASEKLQSLQKDAVSEYSVHDGTPVKSSSTPVRLMVGTPEVHTPKQPVSARTSPHEGKRSARTKLFATREDKRSVEQENRCTVMSTDINNNDDSLGFLPKSLLQSVKLKEKRALEEKEAGFVTSLKRQRLMANLPGTFDIIFLIYQSRQHTVMTKQELIHKIITSNPKVVDRGEVEEQLRLLQEAIPDWISEKTAQTGDILCCVNTAPSQAEIRQTLQILLGKSQNYDVPHAQFLFFLFFLS